jgi:hypothetical protein
MDSLDKQRNYERAEKLLSEQNFGTAVIAGVVAAILLAGIYGIVKSLSDGLYYSILAAGIGVVIGFTMQFLGRGIDRKFALVASVYALLSCMLGNMFAAVMHEAQAIVISPFDVFFNTAISDLCAWIFTDLHFADLMFWIIGIGGAAYFARRPLTREESLAIHTYKMRR